MSLHQAYFAHLIAPKANQCSHLFHSPLAPSHCFYHQVHLLNNDYIMYAKTIELATGMESAERNAQMLNICGNYKVTINPVLEVD